MKIFVRCLLLLVMVRSRQSLKIEPIEDRVFAMMPAALNVPAYICCMVRNGPPSMLISWTKKSAGVDEGAFRYLRLNHSLLANTLCLELYSRRPIQETLFCNAESAADAIQFPVTVRFVSADSDPKLFEQLPRFVAVESTQNRRGIAAEIGSSVEISWDSQSLTSVRSVKWFMKRIVNGESVLDQVRNSATIRMTTEAIDAYHSKNSLRIRNIRREHDGIYVCEIRNEHGWAFSQQTRLAIRGLKSPARIIEPKTDLSIDVDPGEMRTLRCQATGVPVPETAWYRAGKRVQSSEGNQLGLSVLTVRIVEDQSEFECVSRNSLSSDRRFVRFHLREPELPANLELIKIASHSARIRIHQQTSATSFLRVEELVGEDGGGDLVLTDEYALTSAGQNDEHEIQNLKPNTIYRVTVAFEGRSRVVSDPLVIRTEPSAPECPITDLRIARVGESFVELEWSDCGDFSSDLNYVILFTPAQQNPSESTAHWNKQHSGPGNRQIVSNLESNTTFIFYVVSLNQFGTGPASNAASATTFPSSSISLKVDGDDDGSVSWRQLVDVGAISHYVLKYTLSESSGDSTEHEKVLETSNFRLPPAAKRVQVIGYNGDLVITSSDVINLEISGKGKSSGINEISAQMSDLHLQSQSPSSINASWKWSSWGKSAETIFKVSWSPFACPLEEMTICTTYEHNVTRPNYIIQDLTPGVRYLVSVTSGAQSLNASTTTLAKHPPPPKLHSIRRYNSTNVHIRMNRVPNYPRVRDYVIRYVNRIVVDQWSSASIRKSMIENWKSVVVQDRTSPKTIDIDIGGLENRSVYTLAVSARADHSGELVESQPSQFYVVDTYQPDTVPAKKYTSSLRSPRDLSTVNGTIRSNSVQLSFRYRQSPDDQANYIEVVYEGIQSYIDSLGYSQRYRDVGANNITLRPQTTMTDGDLYVWILSALLPNTLYAVNVSAVKIGQTQESSYPASVSFQTRYDVPPYIEIPYFLGADKEARTVDIGLKPASSKNGPISLYFVVLERFDLAEPYGISSAYSFRDSIDPHQKTIALFNQSTGLPQLFTIGNNASFREFHNHKNYRYVNEPLESSGKYRVKLCVQVRVFGDENDNKEPMLIDCSSYSSVFTLASIPRRRTSSAQKFSTRASFNYSLVWLIAIGLLIVVILSIFVILVFQIRRVNSRSMRSYPSYDETKQGLLDSKIQAVKNKASFTSGPSINDFQNVPLLNHPSTTLLVDESSNGTFVSHVQKRDSITELAAVSTGNPIGVSEFLAVLDNLKQNDHFALSQEYDSIDPGQQFTWKYSLLDSNRSKNRYANITAYDHSRVVIQGSPGTDDYINANYIDGFLRPRAYIATQGPLTNTINDFWRMVWQERCPAIVMLTRLEERQRKKCDRYWPRRKNQAETYGEITISLAETHEFASYSLRTLKLSSSADSSHPSHSLYHLQFTAWPDHGVPVQCTDFLMFCQRVRSLIVGESTSSPLLVHCSAGVGRTGCFVVVHNLMLKLESDLANRVFPLNIDLLAYVTQIRAQRNYMVQTDEQYAFIYDCMAELVRYGGRMNHCVASKDLLSYVQNLLSAPGGDLDNQTQSISRMEVEFKRLASGKASPDKFFTATLELNRFKNRLVNILPFEWNRFVLRPPIVAINDITGLSETCDYINASWIDSYEHKRTYIAAQGPLPNTITEFWMMVWQSECSIIVMLTKLMEMGKERCAQYWPQQGFAEYSHLRIDSVAHYNMRHYTVSEFKLTHIPDGKTRTIRQFRFLKWPDQGVPEDPSGFLDFLNQVQKTKEQFGLENGPIIVHCSSGVAQTGIFITISLCIERLRLENLVDVFMTVRTLRSQRLAMVQTEDQYQFCYRAILQYIGCVPDDQET